MASWPSFFFSSIDFALPFFRSFVDPSPHFPPNAGKKRTGGNAGQKMWNAKTEETKAAVLQNPISFSETQRSTVRSSPLISLDMLLGKRQNCKRFFSEYSTNFYCIFREFAQGKGGLQGKRRPLIWRGKKEKIFLLHAIVQKNLQ